MHELAIASSILETVLLEAARRNLPPVLGIAVRLGALSNVDPEALQFGFEALKRGTALESARLQIEVVAVQGSCRACGKKLRDAGPFPGAGRRWRPGAGPGGDRGCGVP